VAKLHLYPLDINRQFLYIGHSYLLRQFFKKKELREEAIMRRFAKRYAVLAGAISLSFCHAASANDYYRGRTNTLNIGYSPGGSYDFYGRVFSRHFSRNLSGSPSLVVQTMPGAGSLRAANYMSANAPTDGTQIAIVTQAIAIEEALGNPGVKYNSAEFGWIGRISKSVELSVTWHTSKVKTIQDALKLTVPVASTGPGSGSDSYPRLLNGTLGTKFKVVSGYPGSNDAMMALERGEVEGGMPALNTLLVSKPDWLPSGKVNVLVQYGGARAPELPDVPTLNELAQDPGQRAMFEFYSSAGDIGRAFFTTPKTPPAALAELRAAFSRTMKDAEFIDELQRARADYSPASGEEVQKIIQQTVAVSPDTVKRLVAVLEARE
jgi:tripartite-type tricarboxylate transporter receptor subunit TctC